MSKISLITGVTGQDGSYLAELLLSKGYEVHGVIRRHSTICTERIAHLLNEKNFYLHYGDMTDSHNLTALIGKVKPDEVYNLAAQSHVGTSFEVPEYTAEATGIGALRLLEAIRQVNPKIKCYQASSSELFGGIPETAPQNEKTPFYPKSPYGAAKLYAYWIAVNYREAYNIFACNGILFNHESPRRGTDFVTRKITTGIAKICAGKQEKISLGNLNSKRDWGFAGDYVEGMWLILQQDKPDDFVLATGETHTVREFAEAAFAEVGIKIEWRGNGLEEQGICAESGRVLVEVNPKYFRPAEVDLLLGDPSKAEKILGWRRKVSFRELVKIMVEADLKLYKGA